MTSPLDVFRRAFEHCPQGIVLTDPLQSDNSIVYCNQRFMQLTGLAPEEILAGSLEDLQSPEPNSTALEALGEAFRQQNQATVTLLNYRRDGQPYWSSLSISPIFDESGKLQYFLGIQTDITPVKELEERYRRAASTESLGHLACGVVHDVNNCVQAIIVSSQMLLQGPRLNAEDRELLGILIRSGELVSELMESLLAWTRIQPLHLQQLDLSDLVESTTKWLEHFLPETIELQVELTPQLPRIFANRTQAQQILLNLTINAKDAMPQGGVLRIRTGLQWIQSPLKTCQDDLPVGEYVTLLVQDTGCGMAPHLQARIFEPFFTTKRFDNGTGTGLVIVSRIVQQWRGYLCLESRPGHGTTFTLYFPVHSKPGSTPSPTEAS